MGRAQSELPGQDSDTEMGRINEESNTYSQQIEESKEEDSTQIPKSESKGPKKIGRWTQEEHEKFLDALRQYGKDWHMIQRHVKTRKVTNVRAHA